MPHLSHAQSAARQQLMQLAQTSLAPEQLGSRLLTVLQLAVPADIQALFGIDPGSLLFNRLLAANTSGVAEQLAWLQHVYLANEPSPGLTFPALMRAHLLAVALHDRPETSWSVPARLFAADHYRLYHEIGTPAGGVLRGCFAVDSQWIAVVQLLRPDANRPFQRSDVAFLRLLAPTIARMLRAAFEREHALASIDSSEPDVAGVLVLAPHRRLLFHNAAAERWCDLLRATEAEGGHLPTAVLSAVACLQAGTDTSNQRIVRVPTQVGTIRVEASLGVEDGSMTIVLTPEHPPAPPDLPLSWSLTPQERQILSLVARGLSNRQVAAKLVISENTVASHLSHAYEKLGVHSRSEFLARFFRESYWPMLQSPGPRILPE